ncbi:hypothetical protein [Haloplanus pelagicus]|uniref:hypothetical protein n=1 Tax=Haloplanus pelagicus TaxID=2949995 RepID=UPI00203C8A89|nr:hypothetical protein [Haloplanus sp. HW8-1]
MKNVVASERGDYIRIDILGIIQIDLGKLIHHVEGPVDEKFLCVAVENLSDGTWEYNDKYIQFVGEDGNMYSGLKDHRFSDDELPPGWFSGAVLIDPGAKVRMILTLKIPENGSISKVVYEQCSDRGFHDSNLGKYDEYEKIEIELSKVERDELNQSPAERGSDL